MTVVAFHFTWRPDLAAVLPVLGEIEDRAGHRWRPGRTGARCSPHHLRSSPRLYPRFDDFRALAARLDPDRTFANDFLVTNVLGPARVMSAAVGGIPSDLGGAMRSGSMYNDLDDRLVAARAAAVRRSDAFNATVGLAPEVRLQALRELVAVAGDGTFLEPTFRCEFGVNIRLGQRFYANFDCIMLDGADITIGDDVLFGPRVSLYTANHALDPGERRAGACQARPISIGDAVVARRRGHRPAGRDDRCRRGGRGRQCGDQGRTAAPWWPWAIRPG